MQLVGRVCIVCGKGISFAPEAAGCVACESVFHSACLPDPDECPKCGGRFLELSRDADLSKAELNQRALASGGRLVGAISIALLGLQAIYLAFGLYQGKFSPYIGIQFLVFAVCVFAMYNGNDWARLLLALTSGLGAPFAMKLGWTSIVGGNFGTGTFMILAAVIYFVSCLALLLSKDAEVFFASQKKRPN